MIVFKIFSTEEKMEGDLPVPVLEPGPVRQRGCEPSLPLLPLLTTEY